MSEAHGYPCPKCGAIVAEVEGWITEANPRGHFRGMVLWCVSCEHRWSVAA